MDDENQTGNTPSTPVSETNGGNNGNDIPHVPTNDRVNLTITDLDYTSKPFIPPNTKQD